MKRLKHYIKKLRWLWAPQFKVVSCQDQPKDIVDNKVYLIGHPEPDMACLKCPGGCGKNLYLNLDEQDSPHWRIMSKKRITIHPSIWNQTDCGCHFWIRKGKINWCTKHLF